MPLQSPPLLHSSAHSVGAAVNGSVACSVVGRCSPDKLDWVSAVKFGGEEQEHNWGNIYCYLFIYFQSATLQCVYLGSSVCSLFPRHRYMTRFWAVKGREVVFMYQHFPDHRPYVSYVCNVCMYVRAVTLLDKSKQYSEWRHRPVMVVGLISVELSPKQTSHDVAVNRSLSSI